MIIKFCLVFPQIFLLHKVVRDAKKRLKNTALENHLLILGTPGRCKYNFDCISIHEFACLLYLAYLWVFLCVFVSRINEWMKKKWMNDWYEHRLEMAGNDLSRIHITSQEIKMQKLFLVSSGTSVVASALHLQCGPRVIFNLVTT